MKRLLVRAALALTATAALLVSGQAPANAAKHTGPNWSWTGPAAWTASYGTFGLTVSGDKGATFDLGFGTTVCSAGATWQKSVTAWFKAKRQQLKSGGWTITFDPIYAPPGFSSTYRRQVVQATHPGFGKTGEILLDYDFLANTGGANYCYQRTVAKYADSASWTKKQTALANVQGSLVYSGAGAPAGQDPTKF